MTPGEGRGCQGYSMKKVLGSQPPRVLSWGCLCMNSLQLSRRDNPGHDPQGGRKRREPRCVVAALNGFLTAGRPAGQHCWVPGWWVGLGDVLGESTPCFRLAQEVSRRQKGLLTPGELRPWPSRQARSGPGHAGSQPRGQDSRREALSCGTGRQGGASGGRGADVSCLLLSRQSPPQPTQSRQAGPCRGDQTGR